MVSLVEYQRPAGMSKENLHGAVAKRGQRGRAYDAKQDRTIIIQAWAQPEVDHG